MNSQHNNANKVIFSQWRRWLCFVLMALTTMQAYAAQPVSSEYQIKAALIYKLTKFVKWPEATDSNASRTFKICILGRDDFGKAIDDLENRNVDGRAIKIHRFEHSDTVDKACRVLFVSDSKRAFLTSILKGFDELPILTIGDSSDFAVKGGMIELTSVGKRIGFKINLNKAKSAELIIAAPLLELATIVE